MSDNVSGQAVEDYGGIVCVWQGKVRREFGAHVNQRIDHQAGDLIISYDRNSDVT